MVKIITYSLLLIMGMLVSQVVDLSPLQPHLTNFTMVCLSYIMMEVGLEFVLDKKNLSSYATDYMVAMVAAALPWLLCSMYFYYVVGTELGEALLVGRFAAPTSAGVLFAMLAAAGLGTTWLFKKARILAIFDDLDTIILMIPLQMMFVGLRKEAVGLIVLIALSIYLAYRYLHQWKLPLNSRWLLLYSILVVGFCQLVENTIHVQFEVLLPAFVLGAIIYNPHDPKHPERYRHEHAYIEPQREPARYIDYTIKNSFMFLVGCTIPKLQPHVIDKAPYLILMHVLLLTILSNIGKLFPTFCYRKEATLRERFALSVAMFPRGEVGAGVLLVALEFDLNEHSIALAGLSLALNLVLTGFFVLAVLKLNEPYRKHESL